MDVSQIDSLGTLFTEERHMRRFSHLADRTGGKADHSTQYMMACFMLSAIGSIYRRAVRYVDSDGINFPEMLSNEPFSSGESTYVRAAWDLFGCVNSGACLWEISNLSDDFFLYVMKGLFLSRVHVV